MELRKCMNGHYYDASIYSECPTCNNTNNLSRNWDNGETIGELNVGPGGMTGGRTMPLDGGGGRTMPLDGGGGRTMPLDGGGGNTLPIDGIDGVTGGGANQGGNRMDDSVTIGLGYKNLGYDPVVGWLVSINGTERGRDYRIHSDNNFIGRNQNMDICIRGDDTISKVRHAVISYDSRGNRFYLAAGEGRSLVRINDIPIFGMTELHAMDIIEIGMTRLVFVPLCGDSFVWEK